MVSIVRLNIKSPKSIMAGAKYALRAKTSKERYRWQPGRNAERRKSETSETYRPQTRQTEAKKGTQQMDPTKGPEWAKNSGSPERPQGKTRRRIQETK